MDLLNAFRLDHQRLKNRVEVIEAALRNDPGSHSALFFDFQAKASAHLKRKDLFYARLDDGRRIEDRVLMHDLRNNHAAVVFSLESLGIRLRKSGPNEDWQKRWAAMVEVLIPHLEKEEKELFPLALKWLSADEQRQLTADIEALL